MARQSCATYASSSEVYVNCGMLRESKGDYRGVYSIIHHLRATLMNQSMSTTTYKDTRGEVMWSTM